MRQELVEAVPKSSSPRTHPGCCLTLNPDDRIVKGNNVMTNAPLPSTTRNSRVIKASREALYQAFIDPAALIIWLPPGDMTAKIYSFDARVGGGYRMSLFYPESEQTFRGKTSEKEDDFVARFVELTPPTRIIQTVIFNSPDPAFSGEMALIATFAAADGGTEVTIECKNIPPGIRPEDNEEGCRSSLEKLARYAESKMSSSR
jgi:uncharacterized protein YndB with AHSA1/START domain